MAEVMVNFGFNLNIMCNFQMIEFGDEFIKINRKGIPEFNLERRKGA
jgi:hypothetical protein